MTQRELHELIDTVDPAWPLIQEWIASARHTVEVLERDPACSERTLMHLQVTTHSVLGAIAWETGGIVVDRGWLRVLGSGHSRMQGDLLSWNGIGEDAITNPLPGAFVVAHDAIGGFFALNGGAFPGKTGSVFYFAPDTLAWEDLERPFSAFVQWALQGDLEGFSANARWPEWEREVAGLSGDDGISIYPPLWAAGESVSERSRRAVPMTELWGIQHDIAGQLRDISEKQ